MTDKRESISVELSIKYISFYLLSLTEFKMIKFNLNAYYDDDDDDEKSIRVCIKLKEFSVE